VYSPHAGAWWVPERIASVAGLPAPRSNGDIIVYFEKWVHERLGPLLKRLIAQGKIVIWRDTAPAGDEHSSHTKYFYYGNFEPQNQIMHRWMRGNGGYYLPIYGMSNAQWRQHIGFSKLANGDSLHWCAYEQESVPNLWNQLLLVVLQQLQRQGKLD
jgi:hypothetical protein